MRARHARVTQDPEQGMDRALKERIIGAIVLVAVVVLVVPVFLDGPPENEGIVSERISLPGQENDGTRTIVLDRDRSEPVPEERSPEPEPAAVAPAESAARGEMAREEPGPGAPAEAVTAAPVAPDPVPQEPEPVAETRVAEPVPSPTRSSTGMWAVQLGSFSNEANAERLAADLRQQGFAAFLSKLGTGNGELHRVRVGPQRDRESAEAMLARLERAGQKGQVVPHP